MTKGVGVFSFEETNVRGECMRWIQPRGWQKGQENFGHDSGKRGFSFEGTCEGSACVGFNHVQGTKKGQKSMRTWVQ